MYNLANFLDDQEKCFSDIVDRVQNIKNVRAFGTLLKIEPWKLDKFERDSANTPTKIVVEWFRTPMSVRKRWEELSRVLEEPAVQERKLAKDIQPLVRQRSSIDSAIAEMSSVSRSFITSSTEVLPQYQMPYIGEYKRVPIS